MESAPDRLRARSVIPAMALLKPSNRDRPVDYFMLQEPYCEGRPVGTFSGQTISEGMTDYRGDHYRFARVAPRLNDGRYDLDALRSGEWIVEPGLLYASAPRQRH